MTPFVLIRNHMNSELVHCQSFDFSDDIQNKNNVKNNSNWLKHVK